MDLFEELELPPWEKFRRYGLFPYKMVLNISLTILITVVVILINISFANYSRAIWLSAANIFYPPDYTDYQSSLLTPYQYYIYTQNQTIEDSNRLVNSYFNLKDLSVNDVDIYNNEQSTNGLDVPNILVELTSGTVRYDLTNGTSSYWPLSYQSINSINTRQFFNDFKQMIFHFYLKSYGNSDDYSYQKNLCFIWEWKYIYNFNSNGQILVTADISVLDRCQQLPSSSTLYALAGSILILAIIYQLLLFKAVARQLIILYNIKESLEVIDAADGEKRNSFSSRQSSKDSISGKDLRESLTGLLTAPKLSPKLDGTSRKKLKVRSGSGDLGDDLVDGKGEKDETEEETELTKLIRNRLSENNQNAASNGGRNSLRSRSQIHERLSLRNAHNASSTNQRSESAESIQSGFEENIGIFKQAIRTLTWEDVFIIINLWFLVATVGNLFAFIYSVRIVAYREDTIATPFLKGGLGIACLMYWFSLIQYLEFFPRYYIMISMLKITAPRVSQFLLGVLPIFIGYALLGMICFGDVSEQFGDITQTLRTLFSVVNGDIIYDTFHTIEFAGIGGQLYIYVYILIFTYVVLMTIIAIVEEAFFESQERKGITNSTINTPAQHPPPSSQQSMDGGGGGGNPSSDHTGSIRLISSSSRNLSSQKNSAIDKYLLIQYEKRRKRLAKNPDSPSSSSSDEKSPDEGIMAKNNDMDDEGYVKIPSETMSPLLIPDDSFSMHSSASKVREKSVDRSFGSRASSADRHPHRSAGMQQSLSANNLQSLLNATGKPTVSTMNIPNNPVVPAPVGKRDVPEHLKVLLHNVERRSSLKPTAHSTLRRTLTNPTTDDTTTTTTSPIQERPNLTRQSSHGFFPFLSGGGGSGAGGTSGNIVKDVPYNPSSSSSGNKNNSPQKK